MAPNRLRTRALSVLACAGLLGVVATACEPAPPPPPPPPATVYDAACSGTLVASTPGSIGNPAVVELSGIAASRRNAGVWWVHNDSGAGVRNVVYAVGDDGADRGAFTITNAPNVDWEDIAVGPGPTPGTSYLYIADIGNNTSPKRNAVDVYRVEEPAVTGASGSLTADKLTFTYPGGAEYDAETLIVDPTTGELFIVTKEAIASRVLRAPGGLAAGTTTAMAQVATVATPSIFEAFTGGDVTAAGDFVALRTDAFSGNGSVLVFPRPAGQSLAAAFAQARCNGGTGAEAQGEAIGFTADGRGYVTASEGANPALHRFLAP